MDSYFSLSNETSSSSEASLRSLASPLGSSEESFFTNSKKLALLDSPHPRELTMSLLFSISEKLKRLKFKTMNDGSLREDHGDNRSPTAAEGHRRSLQKSSIFGVCSNLVNSMVGGGIVGIPYAFKLSGFLTGVYLLFITAILSDKSMRIIVDMAEFHPRLQSENVKNYEELASYPFGPFGEKCVLYATFFLSYGTLVSYLIIIKDALPVALGLDGYLHQWIPELVLLVVSILVILPLSLQRDLSSLSFTSILSVLSVISLLGFVFWYSPVRQSVSKNGGFFEIITADSIMPSFIMGMGIFGDAFACQHAAFVLSGSLHKLTPQRWGFTSGAGIGFTCLMFLSMGVVGFFGFYDETDSDILNNFDSSGFFGRAARLLLAISMCFTYPVEAFVCRHVLTQVIYGEAEKERLEYLNADNKKQRCKMTLLVFCLTMVAGLILQDLGIILALTGIIGMTTMAYIGPGMIYLGIFGDEFLYVVSKAFTKSVRIFHVGQCVGLPSNCPTISTEEKLLCLNAQRLEHKRIDRFLEIQLHQRSSMSTASSFNYKWVKGNLVNTWEDSLIWFLLGMPLWCRVASIGMCGMDQKLGQSVCGSRKKKRKHQPQKLANPKSIDFVVAIVFIIYGTMTLIGGIVYIFLYGAFDAL